MNRKIPLGIVLGAALAVAVAVAGTIWVMGQGSESVGDTARLIPSDVALYVTINTDPTSRQWVQMSSLLTRLGLQSDALTARDQGLQSADLDWDNDVAPYLGGEATIALRDIEDGEPEVMAVLATRDGKRAWEHTVELLDKQASGPSDRPTTRTYRGTEIRAYASGIGESLWIARSGRYLLLGTNDADAERMLDLAGGTGDSLAGLDRFRRARAAVTDDSLLFLYINPVAFGDAAAPLTESFAPGVSGDTLDAAGLEKAAIALAATAERKGLRFEWQTVGLDSSRNPIALKPAPRESRFAQRVPADTLLFITGANLYESFIKSTLARAEQLGASAADVRGPIDDFNRETGIDLEGDLLNQFTGEYAVAAGGTGPDLEEGWLLALSVVRDGGALSRTLAKLEGYVRGQGESVRTSKSGSRTITQIGDGGTGSTLAYTLDGNELIVGSDAAVVQKDVGNNSLARDPDYREALTNLPSDRAFTVYVGLARALQLVPDLAEELGVERSQNLRSLSVALTQSGDRAGGVLFLRIGGE